MHLQRPIAANQRTRGKLLKSIHGYDVQIIHSEVPGTSFDIYLNDVAYWRNVPASVWDYTIGGYQVIKKWLSYREKALLGRGLTIEEAQEVTAMARRIAAILLLESALDANYAAVAGATYAWGAG